MTIATRLSPQALRAMRARTQLTKMRDADAQLFTACQVARMGDTEALDLAEAFDLDLDTQPTVCLSRRVHVSHGTCGGLNAEQVADLRDRLLDDAL